MVVNVTDYTGNISLDTVLTAKVDKAYQQGIIMRPAVALYGKVCIEFLDLVLILGNALDNAIEATAKISNQSNKIIYLNIKLENSFLLISISNTVKERISINNNSIVTSKKDSELHGLGLGNIKMLTQKYNGTMVLRCTDNMFTLKILLENESENKYENY